MHCVAVWVREGSVRVEIRVLSGNVLVKAI